MILVVISLSAFCTHLWLDSLLSSFRILFYRNWKEAICTYIYCMCVLLKLFSPDLPAVMCIRVWLSAHITPDPYIHLASWLQDQKLPILLSRSVFEIHHITSSTEVSFSERCENHAQEMTGLKAAWIVYSLFCSHCCPISCRNHCLCHCPDWVSFSSLLLCFIYSRS